MLECISDEIAKAFTLDDRGNTVLEADAGGMVFVATVAPNTHFIITYLPDNYPCVETSFQDKDRDALIHYLRDTYACWKCRKNNHDLPLDPQNDVYELDCAPGEPNYE